MRPIWRNLLLVVAFITIPFATAFLVGVISGIIGTLTPIKIPYGAAAVCGWAASLLWLVWLKNKRKKESRA
jgi:membrane associated rhomboid family serine protease